MKILDALATALTQDSRFVDQDGNLAKTTIIEAANALDQNLLRILYGVPELRTHFFTLLDEITVFDKEKFQWVLTSKQFLPDSYTKYRNKIGLSDDDSRLLGTTGKVTLVWPFKDCVLEGGQSTEEEQRNEIFYNETLAPEEIGRLLAAKAFRNAVRYTTSGQETTSCLNSEDNLIIKGNNLLALTSLLERFRGQVKCIYIDPPYNTGSDSFQYNDRFNRSTWLTFMRNRIKLALSLLADDGLFFIQCDDHQQAYLKVLMDELLPNGFLNCIAVKMSESSGVKMAHSSSRLPKLKEYILLYKKKHCYLNEVRVKKGEWDSEYKTVITGITQDELTFVKQVIENTERTEDEIKAVQSILDNANYQPLHELHKKHGLVNKEEIDEFNFENAYRIFQTASMGSGTTEAVNHSRELKMKNIFFAHITPQKKMYIIKGDYSLEKRKPRVQVLFADKYLEFNPGDFWSDIKTTGLDGEGLPFKNGKKPEALIRRILRLATQPGDLVLDFHLGSGTTAAVAHKMGRRYIGVEQMDYIDTVTVPRLQKVIEGESSGVSQIEEWTGGGSFVYVQLADNAERFMHEVKDACTAEDLQCILQKVTHDGLLKPNLLPSELQEDEGLFESLSFEQQQRVVAEVIDKNRLYVNASDIYDDCYELSEADKAFTRSFYEMKADKR